MMQDFIVKARDWYLVNIKWRRYHIGKNFHAGRNVVFWAKNTLEIGDNCYIGRNSQIECNVKIGNDVLIANNVAFVGKYDHNYTQVGTAICHASQIRDVDYGWKELSQETIIGNDVWIGYGAIIVSGVTIGKGSIVGAGSVVTKNVDSYSIYAGNPAKKIGARFPDLQTINQHEILYNQFGDAEDITVKK